MKQIVLLCCLLFAQAAFPQGSPADSIAWVGSGPEGGAGLPTNGWHGRGGIEEAAAGSQSGKTAAYLLIPMGLLTIVWLYLVFGPRFIAHTRTIDFLRLLALLLFFQSAYEWLHPFTENFLPNTLVAVLAWTAFAGTVVYLHYRIEGWTARRLLEKNKRIRLAEAKKSIERAGNRKAIS